MKAELHAAHVWDCDACGAENFERAVEGDLDEAMLGESDVAMQLLAPDCEEAGEPDSDGMLMMQSRYLVTRIAVVPKHVTCKACGATFEAEPVVDEID